MVLRRAERGALGSNEMRPQQRNSRKSAVSILAFAALIVLLVSCRRCQYIDVPPPTKEPVPKSALNGTWYYHTVRGTKASVDLRADGSFEQRLDVSSQSASTVVNGTWELSGANLLLFGFRYSEGADADFSALHNVPVTFYITTWYTKGFAPYGGDGDPDVYEVWRRK